MRTNTLRKAISIALFAVTNGAASLATAQNADQREAAQVNNEAQDAQHFDLAPDALGASPNAVAPQSANATELETITVTGTRIRGGTTPSPVITLGSERIREEGFADLGEVIRSVPQNFTGGQNPGVLMGNVAGGMANQNATGGSGLNLRGLGPDASLTLLNGRRMSYGGFVQAVDISAIPVEAVERVEIVADGASAIYGSDAVGGVGNVILKRDFEGVAVGARYGAATDGGLRAREYSATAGHAWTTGGLIASYRTVDTDPIFARQRRYTQYLPEPTTIYAGSDQHNGLVSAHQMIGEAATVRLDALRSEREQAYAFYSTATMYNRLSPDTTTTYVSPSIEFAMPGDWQATVGAAWGRDELLNVHAMVDAVTLQATPYLDECFCNTSRSYDISAEGPFLRLGDRSLRLAIGAGYRTNEFLWSNRTTGAQTSQGRESSRFAYAELHAPLLGDGTGPGGHRLEMTGALRGEDYASFGSVTTPKLGLIYAPGRSATFKASWGRSFKAPTLLERYRPMAGVVMPPSAFGETNAPAGATLLFLNGGNPDLQAERARTSMLSVAFHPVALPGLEAELSWFDIDYMDRVIQPDLGSSALSNPLYADYVERNPGVDRLAALVASVDQFYNFSGAPYDPARVVAVVDGRYVNTLWQKIRGLDLTGSYRFDLGAGRMTLRGGASWLDSSQQTMGAAGPLELAGTLYNPPRVRGRAGTVWTREGLSASVFANYAAGVLNTRDGRKGASFTTVDMVLRYRTAHDGAPWSGLDMAVSFDNLLDRAPPLYAVDRAYVPPYDSTNYSAIGRLVSVSIGKHW